MDAGRRTILKTAGLRKEFRKGIFSGGGSIVAVCGLDLELRQGEIFGFLGPNGAGKTTTLRMLTGIVKPTAGRIEVFGKGFVCPQTWPLSRIGFVPENSSLPGYMTVLEILLFFAKLCGVPRDVLIPRLKRLLEVSGLAPERNILIAKLSMGKRRLVDFLLALVNDPDLVFLDEPTVYLDPLAVERFSNIILSLKEEGKTILMSSHSLPLIEKLSDNIGIINEGRLLKSGPRQEFLGQGRLEEEFLRMIKADDARARAVKHA